VAVCIALVNLVSILGFSDLLVEATQRVMGRRD